MTRASLVLACGLAAFFQTAPAVHAQSADLTQEEIVERFRAQKTRGLSIAPVAQPDQPGATTTAAATATQMIVPAEEQVNINISFDFDSAALRADQKPKLTAMCGAMKAVDTESFRILGHTDSSGSAEYNQRLSKLRAEEVKRFLIADCGIDPDRLIAVGVGMDMPLLPDDPRADENRRVEFQVMG